MDRLQSARDLYNANVELRGSVIFIQDGNGDYVAETAQQTTDIDAHGAVLELEAAKAAKNNENWEYWAEQENADVSLIIGPTTYWYTNNEIKRNRLDSLIEMGKVTQEQQRLTVPGYVYTFAWFSIDGSDPALNLTQLIELAFNCAYILISATAPAKAHERNVDALIDVSAVEAYDFTTIPA